MTQNHRVVIDTFGPPDVLTYRSEPLPRPGRHQVRIKNLFTGISYGDVLLRRGEVPFQKPPVTPGNEVVGIVDAVGPAVKNTQIGQLVCALPYFGGYAEYVCVPEKSLMTVPSGVLPEQAASLMLNYVMALQMIRAARLVAGDVVLVQGAAGGIGTALVQLALMQGLKVYGTVRSDQASYVRRLGAVPIDYKKGDFVDSLRNVESKGVQAVFDSVGGATFARSYAVLASQGKLIGYGSQQLGATLRTIITRFLVPDGKHASLYMLVLSRLLKASQYRRDLQELFRLVCDGRLQPIYQVYPIARVKEAHMQLEQGNVQGKLVLKISS